MGRALHTRYGPARDQADPNLLASALTEANRANPEAAGWICRRCRQADLANHPHPQITDHNGDCTCACYLTWSTPG